MNLLLAQIVKLLIKGPVRRLSLLENPHRLIANYIIRIPTIAFGISFLIWSTVDGLWFKENGLIIGTVGGFVSFWLVFICCQAIVGSSILLADTVRGQWSLLKRLYDDEDVRWQNTDIYSTVKAEIKRGTKWGTFLLWSRRILCGTVAFTAVSIHFVLQHRENGDWTFSVSEVALSIFGAVATAVCTYVCFTIVTAVLIEFFRGFEP